ncbi:putative adhesin [Enterobacteriaceae bacterium LUAb1]
MFKKIAINEHIYLWRCGEMALPQPQERRLLIRCTTSVKQGQAIKLPSNNPDVRFYCPDETTLHLPQGLDARETRLFQIYRVYEELPCHQLANDYLLSGKDRAFEVSLQTMQKSDFYSRDFCINISNIDVLTLRNRKSPFVTKEITLGTAIQTLFQRGYQYRTLFCAFDRLADPAQSVRHAMRRYSPLIKSGWASRDSRGTSFSSGSGRLSVSESPQLPPDKKKQLNQKLHYIYQRKRDTQANMLGIHPSRTHIIQNNAPPSARFFLRKPFQERPNGYLMIPESGEESHIPQGTYNFVIPDTHITEIICGISVLQDNHPLYTHLPNVDGHTALAHQQKVLFAGQMTFQDGELRSWNNMSGHYQPHYSIMDVDDNIVAFPEHIRKLLPSRIYYAFRDFRRKN